MGIDVRAWWIAAVVAAWAGQFGVQDARAQAGPPPAEHYTQEPLIERVVLSPNGRRLAMITPAPNGRRQAGVIDLVPLGKPRWISGFDDVDVERLHWVNDDRLLLAVYERAPEVRSGGAGLIAVDHDGGNPRKLVLWRWESQNTSRFESRVLPYGWFFHSTLGDGSPDILIYRRVEDAVGEQVANRLARLNTLTSELKIFNGMPPHSEYWVVDAKAQPRMVGVMREGRHKLYWQESTSGSWDVVADFPYNARDEINPVRLDADGQVLVSASVGRDAAALHVFDPKARRVDPQPLLAVEGFDVGTDLEHDSATRRVVGVHFRTDRPMSYWFDDRLDTIQRTVDKSLPAGRFNRLLCGRCESTPYVVVHSTSDTEPGEYHLLDVAQKKLEFIGASRPWIKSATQGKRTFHRVRTRDGLSMPVYVTHPPGASATEPLPAVVMAHGGPFVRGTDLRWAGEPQFLASRGYRVIQPEFRGTTGYGHAHFKAGWKQWGAAMQDDLADAVQWASSQRLVDKDRVCVMGGSFGGYAALMSPIRHPGTYRCAVSFAGVADIELMYTLLSSDLQYEHRNHYLPDLVGDRDKDADMLRASSPLQRVAELKVPVLVVHGALDRRVPIDHARKFVSSARSAGVKVEDVYYPREGHGWFEPANHADFLRRVEAFLAKSLAPAK